tara:strand:- start:333 stop:677 length:345 start_codon:yes stop_codon:yes gene_type:complete
MYNITSNDYSFVENDSVDFYGVSIKTRAYKGVVVVYGSVSIKESPELDIATLSFNYNIQDPASWDHDKLRADEDFNNYLGDLLQHIILDSLEHKDAQIGTIDTTTDTYTESSSN